MLERDAPYMQIIEHYRREIRAGRLADGDMLPSGREMAAQFGVSVATAAKVATALQCLGLVIARPGVGTVVTAPRPPADRASGGPLLISLASRTPMAPGDQARILHAGVTVAPQAVAAQLGTAPLEEVICRRQAVIRDGSTAALLTSWFPARLAEAVPALLTTGDAAGEGVAGYEPAWGEDWVAARPPTSAEAREFGIKRGSPVVVVHSRRLDAADAVIEYSELVARSDTRLAYRYEFRPRPLA
ncbi:MAG: GntR family transcriptional regulator [Actinomycetota bacterium]|nr:GntR family transcriptional regulator [Actinomycetota bacterium]